MLFSEHGVMMTWCCTHDCDKEVEPINVFGEEMTEVRALLNNKDQELSTAQLEVQAQSAEIAKVQLDLAEARGAMRLKEKDLSDEISRRTALHSTAEQKLVSFRQESDG